jgi:hypothetical protein
MRLLIHQPAHPPIPEGLIRAAAMLNPDGWGLVGGLGKDHSLGYASKSGWMWLSC